MGLRPEVYVLSATCAAAGQHVHPARQGGPVQAGDGPEAGQGWLSLPAEPQQRPREDERGETQPTVPYIHTFNSICTAIIMNDSEI